MTTVERYHSAEFIAKCEALHVDLSRLTPAQCRAARALVGMTQIDLAERASVERRVVINFERGNQVPSSEDRASLRYALALAGVEFLDGGRAGVRWGGPAVSLGPREEEPRPS